MGTAGVGEPVGERSPVAERDRLVQHPVGVQAASAAVHDESRQGEAQDTAEMLERSYGLFCGSVGPWLDVDIEVERLQLDGIVEPPHGAPLGLATLGDLA